MAGANAVEGGADGAADLVDLTSPGAAAMTPAPRLAMPHQALTEPSTGKILLTLRQVVRHGALCHWRCASDECPSIATVNLIWSPPTPDGHRTLQHLLGAAIGCCQ